MTHTQLNIVGLAGNAGVYLTGPICGRLADRKDPKYLFASASLLLFLGYSSIRYFYLYGTPPPSTINFLILVLCSMSTGIGGNAGQTAALNANAKSWPESKRGTTNGIVISGIGLSAFFFSTISTLVFNGEPSALLLLLSIGTTLPMVLAFFLVKPVPHSSQQCRPNTGASELEYAPLPVNEEDSNPMMELHSIADRTASVEVAPPSSDRMPDTHIDFHVKSMFITTDFWLLFLSMSILSGVGLMYINNIGSMIQALEVHGSPEYDQAHSLHNQARQVSIISLCSFSGRITIGVIADLLKTRLNLPRSFAAILISSTFLISQLTLYTITTAQGLWKASTLLGLSYGMLFALYPTLVIDWFGIIHFSENWGFICLAPGLGGNIFSILFGKNLDAHTPHLSKHTGDSPTQCPDGRLCYIDTIRITILTCCLALCITTYASWMDRKRPRNPTGYPIT